MQTLRKLQLCVQLDTSAKQVLLRNAGPATSANQVLVAQRQLTVQKATFVHLVISVQLERLLKLHVPPDSIILTKVVLIFHSVKFARQELLALIRVHLIPHLLLALRVTFALLALKCLASLVCTVLQALL